MTEADRLKQIMTKNALTAKMFAEQIGVQAGTISNILSGRNNPSLEIIKRVLNRFPDLSADWLIFGKGEMLRSGVEQPSTIVDSNFNSDSGTNTNFGSFSNLERKNEVHIEQGNHIPTLFDSLSDASIENNVQEKSIALKTSNDKERNAMLGQEKRVEKKIAQMIILYTDGTFEIR